MTYWAQIKNFNRVLPLISCLVPLVGDKKKIKIADLGSGPYSTIGSCLDGVEIEVYPSDKQDFNNSFWKKHDIVPLLPIEKQDMEHLTYSDDFFDITYCCNALDHTKNALSAVKEMIRVTKPGGWIYIDCSLDQLSTGGRHYWDAKKDGKMFSKTDKIDLKEFGFNIKFIDNHGESRYNKIIATYKKS